MKYSIGILTAVTLFAALILSGCDRPSNQTERSETTVVERDRSSEVEAELRTFRAENQERLSELNEKIEEIKQRIRNESDEDVRERLEERLEEYEETHRDLRREMNNYRASERDDWEDFKDSFSDKMDDLGNSLNDFFSTSNNTTSPRN